MTVTASEEELPAEKHPLGMRTRTFNGQDNITLRYKYQLKIPFLHPTEVLTEATSLEASPRNRLKMRIPS